MMSGGRLGLATAKATTRPLVVALHCSGGTAGQWRTLAGRLEGQYDFFAPSLYGAPGGPVWGGERRFSLTEDARTVLSAIDRHEGPVHLVGHSYGGAVALHAALLRPGRVASVALYEPSAFHLLRCFGAQGRNAYDEIDAIASVMRERFASGAWREAAACFVEYWNGSGAWDMMRPELQAQLVRYLPKAQLDFHALLNEAAAIDDYSRFLFPVRLLCGERSPFPTRLIVERLAAGFPNVDLVTMGGAGHMGPLTHPDLVAHAIAAHIRLSSEHDKARAA